MHRGEMLPQEFKSGRNRLGCATWNAMALGSSSPPWTCWCSERTIKCQHLALQKSRCSGQLLELEVQTLCVAVGSLWWVWFCVWCFPWRSRVPLRMNRKVLSFLQFPTPISPPLWFVLYAAIALAHLHHSEWLNWCSITTFCLWTFQSPHSQVLSSLYFFQFLFMPQIAKAVGFPGDAFQMWSLILWIGK